MIHKTCERCGAPFRVKPYRGARAKWCSKACWSDRTPWADCRGCGGRFKTNRNRRAYCSRACSGRTMVGPASGNWKGGVSLDDERARLSPDLRAWRETVLARDGWTCQHCGATGEVHAHHVEHWSKNEARRFDVTNGLTLCIGCHGKVHGRDFSNRRVKMCPYCERKTSGRGVDGACRSCGLRVSHARRRAALLSAS